MPKEKNSEAPRHIAIFGGGFAGTAAFSTLSKKLAKRGSKDIVTLFSAARCLFYNPPALRSVANPELIPIAKLFYPLENFRRRTSDLDHICVALVREIHADHAFLERCPDTKAEVDGFGAPAQYVEACEDGFKVKFDFAVIALGSSYTWPSKLPVGEYSTENAIGRLKQTSELVAKSRQIAVVGLGTVGLELAAEIKTEHPRIEVTAVGPSLFSPTPAVGRKIRRVLLDKRVLFHDDSRINKKQFLKTQNAKDFPHYSASAFTVPLISDSSSVSKSIEANMLFSATGIEPCSQYIKIENVLLNSGFVAVNDFLQVRGYQRVFAIGDIASTSATKTIYPAFIQGEVTARNIDALLVGRKMAKFKAPPRILVVPLGKDNGVSLFPLIGTCFSKFLVSSIKKDGGFKLLGDRFGKSLGE